MQINRFRQAIMSGGLHQIQEWQSSLPLHQNGQMLHSLLRLVDSPGVIRLRLLYHFGNVAREPVWDYVFEVMRRRWFCALTDDEQMRFLCVFVDELNDDEREMLSGSPHREVMAKQVCGRRRRKYDGDGGPRNGGDGGKRSDVGKRKREGDGKEEGHEGKRADPRTGAMSGLQAQGM